MASLGNFITKGINCILMQLNK